VKARLCDCGCGVKEHLSRLQEIRLEVGRDPKARQTFVARRFLVRKACYEPFINELKAQKLLNDLLQRFVRSKARWYWRAMQFRQVARLQFLINMRNSTLCETRKRSLRAGVMFVLGPKLSVPLWKYWIWADRNELHWRFSRRKIECANRGSQTNSVPESAAQSRAV